MLIHLIVCQHFNGCNSRILCHKIEGPLALKNRIIKVDIGHIARDKLLVEQGYPQRVFVCEEHIARNCIDLIIDRQVPLDILIVPGLSQIEVNKLGIAKLKKKLLLDKSRGMFK